MTVTKSFSSFSSLAAATLISASLAAPARADGPTAPAAQAAAGTEARKMPNVSLTFSPVHLLPIADGDLTQTLLEVTTEVRLADRASVSLTVAGGRMKRAATLLPERTEKLYGAGASARYYAWGDFRHGLQLGLEAQYLGITGDWLETDGLVPGAFGGYKYSASNGFTFDMQIGARLLKKADTSSVQAILAGETKRDIAPLLNLNVGWSF